MHGSDLRGRDGTVDGEALRMKDALSLL